LGRGTVGKFGILPRDILLQIDSQHTVTIHEIKRVVIEPGDLGRLPIAPEAPRLLEYHPSPLPADMPKEHQLRLARILEIMKERVPIDGEAEHRPQWRLLS
jgi:hypothetical protein